MCVGERYEGTCMCCWWGATELKVSWGVLKSLWPSQEWPYLWWISALHVLSSGSCHSDKWASFCCRKGDHFQGPKLGSCLTLGNELSKETHLLTKQEILLGKGTRVASSRVREPRRTAPLHGSKSQVLWWWSLANYSNSESFLVAHSLLSQDGC